MNLSDAHDRAIETGRAHHIENVISALSSERQSMMAELILAGWVIKLEGYAPKRWVALGPAAPDGGRAYFARTELREVIDTVYYSGYFGPRGAL